MPEGTKDVKIGTLIALTVETDQDWKSVEMPDTVAASAAAPKPAPSPAGAPASAPPASASATPPPGQYASAKNICATSFNKEHLK